MYWQQQAARTDNAALREVYRNAHEVALHSWQTHPLTATASTEIREKCQQWAESMVVRFQRTSSAIKGRNACLAQFHHNSRGLSKQRLSALTVLHNFACSRLDGSTPAERLFGCTFPDLFEWVLEHSSPLPAARERRKCNVTNLLNVVDVAG